MEDEEAWLYGDQPQEENAPDTMQPELEDSTSAQGVPVNNDEAEVTNGEGTDFQEMNDENAEEAGEGVDPEAAGENEEDGAKAGGDGSNDENEDDDEDDDDDSDDDGFKITIDRDKIDEAKTTYQTFGLSKPVRPAAVEKKGKYTVEEFDQIGLINGQVAVDVDLESLEEKPWRKPGADLSDYFNYGFTEETWNAYCTRQKRMRTGESGAGLTIGQNIVITGQSATAKIIPSNTFSGQIPILGGDKNPKPSPALNLNQPPPNIPVVETAAPIAVMTSDKRIYSKKLEPPPLDFSVPPPGVLPGLVPPPGLPPKFDAPPPMFEVPPPGIPPPTFGEDPFHEDGPEYDYAYGGGYEPTQESQWSLPPPAESYNRSLPPPSANNDVSEPPPSGSGYEGHDRDAWGRRRTSRDTTPNARSYERRGADYERPRRRSRSRERYERRERDRDRDVDRDRDRDRERSERSDRDRDRERSDRSERRERRRPSRSPSGERHKHKKSKKDKKEKEIKKEKEDD